MCNTRKVRHCRFYASMQHAYFSQLAVFQLILKFLKSNNNVWESNSDDMDALHPFALVYEVSQVRCKRIDALHIQPAALRLVFKRALNLKKKFFNL